MSQNKFDQDVRPVVQERADLTDNLSEAGESLARYEGPHTKAYDVLRFPVIDWTFRWQRPQQMSVQFAKEGHRVFYFSTELTVVDEDHVTLEDIAKHVIIRRIETNIWWVKLCCRRSLNLYRDTIQDPADLQYLLWSVTHLQQLFQLNYTVSVIDLPFWAPLAFRLDNNKVIYDCMDDHAGFSTNSTGMLLEEETLIQNAGLVVASSQSLFNHVTCLNEAAVLIRNAVDYEHFSRPPLRIAKELQGISGPVIGYYGAIAEWFDIGLIAYLAAANKNWTFVLIGHTFGCDTSVVQGLENVILTGEKPYHELPGYLYRFDVCLIPFLVNNLTLATNPVKMYEYLAAGKPLVSVSLPELEAVSDFVYLARTAEEFEQAVKRALTEDDDTLVKRRKQFALANTWDKRYQLLNAKITAQLFPKISIVIVSHNQWVYTKQCLDSLFKNTDYPNLEVIVVDNASTDETKILLPKQHHPNLKIIASAENTGFSGGNTIGCNASTGEYIILLNNDTIVPRGWLTRLIRPLRDYPHIGMTAPMSNHVGNDQMLDHFAGDRMFGADPHWLADFYHFYKGRIRLTELLGFFCVAMKREVYEKVGELDKGYEIGMFEDDDYCERVKLAGYQLAIVEDAFVYHHGSVSFKRMDKDRYSWLWTKNKAYFEQKWGKEWQPPKPPATLFFETYEPEAVAEKIRTAGKPVFLILGERQWPVIKRRWQYIAEALTKDDRHLVIVQTDTYHTNELVGTRKAGPYLYLTNRVDLFEECRFDLVIYCGQSYTGQRWNAGSVAIDAVSYSGQDLAPWTGIPKAVIYHENNIEKLAANLTAPVHQPL